MRSVLWFLLGIAFGALVVSCAAEQATRALDVECPYYDCGE